MLRAFSGAAGELQTAQAERLLPVADLHRLGAEEVEVIEGVALAEFDADDALAVLLLERDVAQ